MRCVVGGGALDIGKRASQAYVQRAARRQSLGHARRVRAARDTRALRGDRKGWSSGVPTKALSHVATSTIIGCIVNNTWQQNGEEQTVLPSPLRPSTIIITPSTIITTIITLVAVVLREKQRTYKTSGAESAKSCQSRASSSCASFSRGDNEDGH